MDHHCDPDLHVLRDILYRVAIRRAEMTHGDCDYCDRGKGEALPLYYADEYPRIIMMYPEVDGHKNACPRCRHQIAEGIRRPLLRNK